MSIHCGFSLTIISEFFEYIMHWKEEMTSLKSEPEEFFFLAINKVDKLIRPFSSSTDNQLSGMKM